MRFKHGASGGQVFERGENMNVDPMQVKLAVIKAACGITALDEIALLRRLEELYLEGAKWGADLMHQRATEIIRSPSTSNTSEAICDK